MFCPKCGKELPDGAKFCTSCGAKIEIHPGMKGEGGNAGANSGFESAAGTGGYQQQPYSYSGQNAGGTGFGGIQPGAKWQLGTIIALIGGALVFIAAFMPVVSASALGYGVSYNYFAIASGFDEAGYMIFGVIQLALGAVLMLLAGFRKKVPGIVVSVISTICALFMLIAFSSIARQTFGIGSAGPGLVVNLLGSIAALVGNILFKKPRKYIRR